MAGAAGALVGMSKSRQSLGIRHRTSSVEELSERRSSIRKSLESGLGLDEEETVEGPVKAKFMPFFRKFWPHLEQQEHESAKRYADGSVGDELVVDEPTDSLKSINPSWYGSILEEVDPFIPSDTFCLITKKYKKNYIYRFSCSKSLFLIGPLNPLRRLAICIVTHQWFDILIILTILANCVTLAMGQNKFQKDGKTYEPVKMNYEAELNYIEYGFLGVYTLEMMLKIFAKGFVLNKFSYLRNKWNMLDFVVWISCVSSYRGSASASSTGNDLEALRTLRVLRAVKTISILPGLRMMINALLSSVVQLLEVMALTLFCLMIFALFALEVYMGKLRHKCVKEIPAADIPSNEIERDYHWKQWVDNPENWLTRDFPKENEFVMCSNDSGTRWCPTGFVCLGMRGENPDDGWSSFDNFFASMLTTFQLITLDYWERIYDLVLSTSGPWSILFFTMVVFLGSYYLLNLMLAVVTMSYEAEANVNDQGQLTKHQKLSLVRTHSTFSFEDLTKLNIKEMTHYRKRTASEREMIAKKLRNSSLGKRKPRRAIRRKQQNVNKGAELTVTEAGDTETMGTPNVKSATGSICGDSVCGAVSVIGGGSGGDAESGGAVAHFVRGSVSFDHSNKQPSPIPRPSSSGDKRPNKPKDSAECKRGEASKGGKRTSSSSLMCRVKKQCIKTSGGGASVISVTKSMGSSGTSGGGKRVSGRVKTVSDKDRNRFILETDDEPTPQGRFGDAILNLLGKRKTSEDELGKETRMLQNLQNESPQTYGILGMPSHNLPAVSTTTTSKATPSSTTRMIAPDASVAISIDGGQGGAESGGDPDLEGVPEDGEWDTFQEVEPAEPKHLFMRHCQRVAFFMRTRLQPMVNHCLFEVFVTSCIIFNTVLLALERHGQEESERYIMETGNMVFMIIFTVEAFVKMLALQADYFRSGWNIFDLIIVTISYVEILLQTITISFSVIRGMRLLRVFKLAQSWITMKVLLNIIFSTFGALGNLTLVLLIVIYIFSVMGMQVIGNRYSPMAFDADEDPANFPRWHFQNFWYAFMMVFRVLCGEWIEPLWDCLQAHKFRAKDQQWKCFVIFLPILIVGNFIVLNLFLALLLNSFNTEELKAQRDKEIEATGRSDNLKTIVGMLLKKDQKNKQSRVPTDSGDARKTIPKVSVISAPNSPTASSPSDSKPPDQSIIVNQDAGDSRQTSTESELTPIPPARARFRHCARKVILHNRKQIALRAIDNAKDYLEERHARAGFLLKPTENRRGSMYGLNSENTPTLTDSNRMVAPGDCIPKKCWNASCSCCEAIRGWDWTTWDKIRQFSVTIVGNPTFEWMILTLIFASSITLAFEDKHLDSKPDLKAALFWLNLIFTIIFVIEMLLKWLAMGLWGYFTNIWTILDAFIVVISLISIYYEIEALQQAATNGAQAGKSNSIGAFKALRTLRAMRPLRAISRWQGMKIVVNALMYAIPSIFNVLLVCLLFWLVFSIMGVQFFKGKFYKCVDTFGKVLDAELVPTREVCCEKSSIANYSWINTTPNFDNVLEGYLALFQIATFEGWMELMRSAVDSTEVGRQPMRDNGLVYYIFFVIFIVFGSFFTLNLFIGVIIDNFNMLKKKYEGNLLEVLLTPSQRHYYTAMKKLGRKKPRKVIKRPSNNFISPFYDLSMSRRFEIAIFIMIFINMVVMAFEHYGQRQIFVHLLAGFNSFFTTIYALEAIVKIIGLRHYYFTVPWNVFDFVLVLASIVDLMVGDLTVEFPIPPTMLRIVRVFRIGRVLRLVKAAKGIRKLLFALVVSLPALFNIGALLGLITFIYAILGMALFKDAPKYNSIDDVFNFETFVNSGLMLFRLMTAAGWNDVLDALTNEEPTCGSYRKIICGRDDEPECPNRGYAVAYIVTYIIISFLIVINMYIAIILENFVEANREEEVGIVEDDLEMFYVRWSRYDPQATQFINFDQVSDFLSSLDPPLTLPKPNLVAIVAFNLPIARGNKIHCLDILHSLVKHVLGQIDDSEEFRKLQDQMERKFQKQFPTRKLLDVVSSTRTWKIQHNSAIIIQRTWRKYILRKHPPPEKQKSTQTVKVGITSSHQDKLWRKIIGGSHDQKERKGRRESIALRDQPNRGSIRSKRSQHKEQQRNSESSISSSSPLTRVDTSSGLIFGRGSSGDGATSGGNGNRGRRLSPSRLSGGSFDVAVNFGNQLSVIRNANTANNCPSPLPSCPTTPSSLAEADESASNVTVQVHHFQ
ncbi:sodium channel protein 60E isoform X2 [Folsomia candida]|uniref:sodium channel protein 60E isoform X2 n=1 Tax=Folsomia candida TaxID=158441 RepID=UPI001604DE86|nr:sodium channel protein 60E isoform X2 [Folsomia candida]